MDAWKIIEAAITSAMLRDRTSAWVAETTRKRTASTLAVEETDVTVEPPRCRQRATESDMQWPSSVVMTDDDASTRSIDTEDVSEIPDTIGRP